jgi:hypothetical protein
MRTIEKISAIVGILGFVGAIIAGFLGNQMASIVMLISVFLAWQLWITKEILSLRRIRSQEQAWLRRYFDEQVYISAEKRNRLGIDSDFLFWEKCTLVMWVFVPPKGQGLRDAPHNRYLLSHNTGEARTHVFLNQFALRYSLRKTWEFECSNNNAEYPKESVVITDGLEPGWHQFLLAWDRSKPKLLFLIDEARSGSKLSSTIFKTWPERRADEVFVGTWTSDWEGHYSETKIFQLWITDNFLESTDSAIKEHSKHKPRT